MAISRTENHPWTDMSEEEILRSSGLILTDTETGKEGITLAAILLFGKDSTIMSVLLNIRQMLFTELITLTVMMIEKL